MITDRREPGVYVSIEDVSYVAPPSTVGRTVYNVGVCPKGPHNRVVEVTSQGQFQQVFGIPNFYKTSKSHYIMDKAMQLTGRGLYVRVVPENAKQAQVLVKKSGNTSGDLVTEIPGTASFTWDNTRTVTVDSFTPDMIVVGDWVFNTEETETGVQYAKQVVSITTQEGGTAELLLDSEYSGTAGSSGCYKYAPFNVVNDSGYPSNIDIPDSVAGIDEDIVYGFYAIGAGSYYNNYKIKGARNVELEKMYTDEDGNVKYPYLFMDLGVYYINDEGFETLVEGPWTTSMVNTTPDGVKIRDLSSGQSLYIQNVINDRSELIRCCVGAAAEELKSKNDPQNATALRKQLMMTLSAGSPAATNMIVPGDSGIYFASGDDGTTNGEESGQSLYDPFTGNINIDENIECLVAQAYNGSLTSIDGSIEQIREVTYPWYQPDYILTGEWSAATQNAGRQLADYRQDCIHLGDLGYQTSYTADLDARLNDVPWNNWTSGIYSQFRKRRDEYTGEMMTISPVYHAIECHLAVDGNYFLAEPVAGIEKGAIAEPIELVYKANHTERGDLLDAELNVTIVEPDGKYFLSQFTSWKRLSILKRMHAAKFVAFVRKMVPPLLKDLLQRKGTPFWVGQGQLRVDNFLSTYMGNDVEALNVLTDYSANVVFDEDSSEINVYIMLKPVRVIERINVYISVA